MTAMTEAELFFYENAGWSYDPETETSDQGKLRCAHALAQAEMSAAVRGWFVSWETDPEPWDGDTPYYGPLWIAILRDREGDCLASIGSVACPGQASDYGRVIDAELADEAIYNWQATGRV